MGRGGNLLYSQQITTPVYQIIERYLPDFDKFYHALQIRQSELEEDNFFSLATTIQQHLPQQLSPPAFDDLLALLKEENFKENFHGFPWVLVRKDAYPKLRTNFIAYIEQQVEDDDFRQALADYLLTDPSHPAYRNAAWGEVMKTISDYHTKQYLQQAPSFEIADEIIPIDRNLVYNNNKLHLIIKQNNSYPYHAQTACNRKLDTSKVGGKKWQYASLGSFSKTTAGKTACPVCKQKWDKAPKRNGEAAFSPLSEKQISLKLLDYYYGVNWKTGTDSTTEKIQDIIYQKNCKVVLDYLFPQDSAPTQFAKYQQVTKANDYLRDLAGIKENTQVELCRDDIKDLLDEIYDYQHFKRQRKQLIHERVKQLLGLK